ncbi:conserved hypothetical protein [Ureaplasma urealyticum serovar 13 str. ATCC 33698]|uniref:hypothetical protein n=1 Tax=Ureaplasma urealyticum TaxID=2130 RepID=UPI00016C091B|nr:hypothetical protein [Ureaplasma urealyticum]EDT49362.1 conserved hypothetical protein [Ureaplasma urealyticum serovar 13 str. ATCC 33698]
MSDKKSDFEKLFERSKVQETSIFDINDIDEQKPYEQNSIEELSYILEYEKIDKKTREKIKKIIKEKQRNL